MTERRDPVGSGGDPDRHRSAAGDRPVGRAVWVRLIALVLLVAAVVVIATAVGLPDVERLRTDIAAAGPIAPAVFVLLYAVATLAPLPKNVLSTLAGVLFGLAPGVAIVLLAALLGAVGAFGLGRVLGRAAVERLTGARVARGDELLRRRGLLAVIGVRLVPVLPFTAINYAAGLTAVRPRDYVIGTAVGIVPGIDHPPAPGPTGQLGSPCSARDWLNMRRRRSARSSTSREPERRACLMAW